MSVNTPKNRTAAVFGVNDDTRQARSGNVHKDRGSSTCPALDSLCKCSRWGREPAEVNENNGSGSEDASA